MAGDVKWPTFRAILLLLTFLHPAGSSAQKEPRADALIELEKISLIYNIEIVMADVLTFPVKTTYGKIRGRRPGSEELQEYVALFAAEFTLYPTDLIQRLRLKHVVLCSGLSYADQPRSAIADFGHDTLYLDVSRGAYAKTYVRKVIHHEIFHIIDYRDDGSMCKDELWEALNPAEFKYGGGGRAAQDFPGTSVLTDEFPGFLNHYSTTGVGEDKAEMFANLIVESGYVENRMKTSPVLDAKVELMKKLLVFFCPDINDTFWEKAAKVDRGEK